MIVDGTKKSSFETSERRDDSVFRGLNLPQRLAFQLSLSLDSAYKSNQSITTLISVSTRSEEYRKTFRVYSKMFCTMMTSSHRRSP